MMMLSRRAFRRFLPVVCCLILLKVYLIREESGVYPDEGQVLRAEAPLQDARRRLPEEGRVLTRTHSIHSQPSEERLGETPSSSASVRHQPHELPLRYGRRDISDAVRHEIVLDVPQEWSPPVWLRITDDLYTYSAFWDCRPGLASRPVARVVGILRYSQELEQLVGYKRTGLVKDQMLNSSCLLWYKDQEEPEEGILKAFIFEEGMKVFVGTYFLCHSQVHGPGNSEGNSSSTSGLRDAQGSSGQLPPYAVSIVPQDSVGTPHKLIYFSSSKEPSSGSTVNRTYTTGVCVRPLHGPYSDLRAMTQFIAYYHTVLGVSHFYFYDLAVTLEVKELLRLFVAVGGEVVVHLLPWNLPTAQWQELWDLGSLAALNDCIYRSSGRHRYVAVVDLDEFIVPRTPTAGLAQLYHDVLKQKNGQEGDAALILNAFFCYDFKDNPDADDDSFPIFRFTQREARLWPPKTRSKMILTPDYIVSVGHHMVHNFLLDTLKNRGSPKYLSVMHHYRACADLRLGIHATGSLVLEQETVKDAAMIRYKRTVLTSRIVTQYRNYLLRHTSKKRERKTKDPMSRAVRNLESDGKRPSDTIT